MTDRYLPESAFLKALIDDEAPLSGGAHGAANLARLIAMTRDPDRSNRDWAAMLLAQHEGDTPEIRAALLAAAGDPDDHVRGEAILGLAARDPALVLPLLRGALAADRVCAAVFEAAALAPHPSLAGPLRDFAAPSGHATVDDLALEALAACEKAGRPEG